MVTNTMCSIQRHIGIRYYLVEDSGLYSGVSPRLLKWPCRHWFVVVLLAAPILLELRTTCLSDHLWLLRVGKQFLPSKDAAAWYCFLFKKYLVCIVIYASRFLCSSGTFSMNHSMVSNHCTCCKKNDISVTKFAVRRSNVASCSKSLNREFQA